MQGLAIAGVAIGVYSHHQSPQDRISNVRVVSPDADGARAPVTLPSAPVRVVAALRKQLQTERAARRKAQEDLARSQRDLVREKARAQEAVSTTRGLTAELSEARGAVEAALATVDRLRTQHVKELRVANASVDELQQLIDTERTAKNEALKATEAIKYELVLERQLRQQAERKATAALKPGRGSDGQLRGAKTTTVPPGVSPVLTPKAQVRKCKKTSDRCAHTATCQSCSG